MLKVLWGMHTSRAAMSLVTPAGEQTGFIICQGRDPKSSWRPVNRWWPSHGQLHSQRHQRSSCSASCLTGQSVCALEKDIQLWSLLFLCLRSKEL